MPTASETSRAAKEPLPRKSRAVLRRIAELLEDCREQGRHGTLLLEINLNQGVPSRLIRRGAPPRHEIPLEDIP